MDKAKSANVNLPDEPQQASAKGRWVLILLFALFLAPVLAAVFLNSRFSDWRPGSTRNYGQLINPVIALSSELTAPAQGTDIPPWQLIWPRTGPCNESCTNQLSELERIRQTLGRHQDKLTIELIDLPRAPGTGIEALLAELRSRSLPLDALFLVDPLGNLMMAYSHPVDPTLLRKDLDRLIRHSKFKRNR